MSNTSMRIGLASIATMLFAGSTFAEPPIQPGDTLDSLSKVKVETSINGQAGSLEQMGLSKDIIAQAVAEHGVIDLQTGRIVAQAAPDASNPASDSEMAAQSTPPTPDASLASATSENIEDHAQPLAATSQPSAEDPSNTTAAAPAIDSTVQAQDAALHQQNAPLANDVQAQALTPETNNAEHVVVSDDPQVAEQVNPTLTQSNDNTASETAEMNAATQPASNEADPNAAALQPESDPQQLDPNAQATPVDQDTDQTQQ